MKISIIIPCYNEADSLQSFFCELRQVVNKLPYNFEFIFINDGSEDNTIDILKGLKAQDSRVQYISFSRNFGQQKAILAGIEKSRGVALITIDADLQHPPQFIVEMIDKWSEGYNVVNCIRKVSPRNFTIKGITSLCFYKLFNKIANIHLVENSPDFRLIDGKVARCIKDFREEFIFLRGIIAWAGFKSADIYYKENIRREGETKYNYGKMFSFALTGVTSFSIKPLRISIYFSCILMLLCIIHIIYVLYVYLFTKSAVSGWSSVMIMISALGAVNLFVLGIIGEYIGKLFIENKKRPRYVIEDEE